MNAKPIRPLYRKIDKKQLLPIATADIETTPIGTELDFLDSCVYYGDETYYHFESAVKLVAGLFSRPGFRYYFHNGARFDFSFLANLLVEQAIRDGWEVNTIVQGESRLIGFLFSKKQGRRLLRFELRDSIALIPLSLDDASKIYAKPENRKTDIGLKEGQTYDPTNPEHIAYLHTDVRGLYDVLSTFSAKVFDLFGVQVGFTTASTAVKAWQAHIPHGHAYYRLHKDPERFIRRCYYGGYVYPGRSIKKHKDAIQVDYNAWYATQMRKGVPVGNPIFTGVYLPNNPGFYHVVVSVPDNIPFPLLPHRDAQEVLSWPIGTFDTYISSLEVEAARKRGCTVDILCGYVFSRLEYPFEEFLDLCQDLEIQQGGVSKEVAKLFRNGLSGKFGMKEVHKVMRVVADDAPLPEGYTPFIDEISGWPVSSQLYFEYEESRSNTIMPHWIAWITAHARMALLDLYYWLDSISPDCVLYGDTDCVVAERSAVLYALSVGKLSIGRRYGEAKIEHEYATFQSLGPKNYHGVGYATLSLEGIYEPGAYVGKCKGIPRKLLSLEIYELYEASGFVNPPEVIWDSVLSAYMVLKHPDKKISRKGGKNKNENHRKLSNIQNSLSWKLQGEKIRPLHLDLKYATLDSG